MQQLVVDSNGEIRHSEEIDEIVTAAPSWLVRWGISIFLVSFAALLVLSTKIRYPDLVKAPLRIVGMQMPKTITSRVDGKIVDIQVTDNTQVKTGQIVGFIESTASPADMLRLQEFLDRAQRSVKLRSVVDVEALNTLDGLNFGEIQNNYEDFVKEKIAYRAVISSGVSEAKLSYISREIQQLAIRAEQLQQQMQIVLSDLKLSEEDIKMHQSLLKEKAETLAEFRTAEGQMLSKKGAIYQLKESLAAIRSETIVKEREMIELRNQMAEQGIRFFQALNSLYSQVSDWFNKYALRAPSEGRILLVNNLQVRQEVKAGQELFYLDGNTGSYEGEIKLPQYNMGKVQIKQEVLIKLHSYPFEQYGVLKGKIRHVNEFPDKDSLFVARVSIPGNHGSGKQVAVILKQGMLGDAEIITKDENLLVRLINNLKRASSTR